MVKRALRSVVSRLAIAATLGLALGDTLACFSAPSADVMFACEPESAPACPSGYTCEADGCCHRDGSKVSEHLGECRIQAGTETPTGTLTLTDATTTTATDSTGPTSSESGTGDTTTSGSTETTEPTTTEPTTTEPATTEPTTETTASDDTSSGSSDGSSTTDASGSSSSSGDG